MNHPQREELSHSLIFEMGKNQNNEFNPLQWAKKFEDLPKSSQKILLSPYSKSHQKRIYSFLEGVPYMKSTFKEANTSKTSHYTAALGFGSHAMNAVGNALSGDLSSFGSLVAHAITARAGAHALTNPKVSHWIMESMKAKSPEVVLKRLENLQKMKGIPKPVLLEAQRLVKESHGQPIEDNHSSPHEKLMKDMYDSGDPQLITKAKKIQEMLSTSEKHKQKKRIWSWDEEGNPTPTWAYEY